MLAPLYPLVLAALVAAADPEPAAPAPAPGDGGVVEALESALIEAIGRSEASVVAIARDKDGKNEGTTAVRGRFPAQPTPEPPDPFIFGRVGMVPEPIPDSISSDFASGVVIGDQNQILTTAHAVKGASRLIVRAAGGPAFEAEIIASDPRSDLAVIVPRPLPAARRPNLKPIAIAPATTKFRKGSFLLALGNPFNAGQDGQASASWGILANTTRRLNPPPSDPLGPTSLQLRHFPTLLQLDAKLNLGMSGGAVVNLKGELVGLTTNAVNAGGFDAQAGYAIPMDRLALRAIEALRQGREVEYGFLGIGLSEDRSNRIGIVQPGTPAGESGLLVDDAILSIEGYPVTDSDSLVTTVNIFPPGMTVKLRINRRGEEMEKSVTLSKLPIQGEVIATNRAVAWRGLRVDYVSSTSNGPFGNGVLDALARGGVRVSEIQPGTPAEDAGLRLGQIITEVAGQKVRNPAEFAEVVARQAGPVPLTVEGDQLVTIAPK